MEIHHIGYLVKNIEKSEKKFQSLGFLVEYDKKYDEIRDVNISFLVNGNYRVELVEPQKTSELYSLLKNYKNEPYHICYIVDSLDDAIRKLQNDGYTVIQSPVEAPCINNQRVAFLYNSSLGIIELLESGNI